MARVLHLHEQSPDYQTQTALEQLTRNHNACSLTIGRGGDFATPLLGILRLRQYTAPFDLIHAWGEPAVTLAAVGSAKRIIYSPTRFPTWRDLRWIRAIMSARDVQVVCPSDTMRRAFVEKGVPIERCHLIRPGVEFAKVNRRRDNELRSRLGFGKDDFVLLGAGESLRSADHHASILAVAVLHVSDPVHRLLLWGRGPMVAFERRYASKMLPHNFIAFATDRLGLSVRFEQLLSAADAALVTADNPVPPLPVAVCMAAALPIIAVVSPTIAEMLEDRHSALMVGRANSQQLARRILDLRDNAQLQWSISDAARTEAYEYFSMTRFVQQYKTVYEQATTRKPVEIPQPAPGAGARFFGRA
jgi:glycosyltransferase involved in cell wall biosynthesis